MPAVVGSRMRLLTRDELRKPMEIGAKVRWQLDEKNGFLIGCELNGVTSAARLHELVFGATLSPPQLPSRQSWLGRLRERLEDFRASPRAAFENLLGLNEHDKILNGASSFEPASTPPAKS